MPGSLTGARTARRRARRRARDGESGDRGRRVSPLMIVIWLALLAGTCAAAAALYGHYRVLPGWLTGPEICQLEDGGCQVLFRTPRARLLGVPNAALGILLYVILAAGLIGGAPVLLL